MQKVLQGDPGGMVSLPSSPGTLAVFRGPHAPHRVTPVSGPRPRINSVLTYTIAATAVTSQVGPGGFPRLLDRMGPPSRS